MQQPSPNCNNDGMGSVFGLELVDQIPDVEIDRGFCDRKVASDLLIAVTVPNQHQNIEFTRRKILRSKVLSEPDCNLRWDTPASVANGTNRLQQLALGRTLQDVGGRAGTEGALNRSISTTVRKHDDASGRKFCA